MLDRAGRGGYYEGDRMGVKRKLCGLTLSIGDTRLMPSKGIPKVLCRRMGDAP